MTVPSSETPRVESFVLRFVADASTDAADETHNPPDQTSAGRWHAVIVHVQSNEEKHFTNIADAVAFIARYVPVGDIAFSDGKEQALSDDRK